MTNDKDHIFLLIGIRPFSLENPQRPPSKKKIVKIFQAHTYKRNYFNGRYDCALIEYFLKGSAPLWLDLRKEDFYLLHTSNASKYQGPQKPTLNPRFPFLKNQQSISTLNA